MDGVSISDANRWASKTGTYRFTNVISKNSFGTVLQAKRGNYGPIMAVQLVKKDNGVTINSSELEFLRGLRHESIVGFVESYPCHEVYENGHASQQLKQQPPLAVAIVLEYCRSGDLQSYLCSYHVGEATRLRWYTDLAEGLQFLHENGVLHRDIRPDNVWIKNDKLKFINVGLANTVWKSKGENKQYCHYIREKPTSQSFQAPEVWEDDNSCRYNSRSEVFSLGLLFVLLSESPDGCMLNGTWGEKRDFLGSLLHSNVASRDVKVAHMITPPLTHSRPQEINLFDWMLQYDSKKRPNMEMVVNEIATMTAKSCQPIQANSSWSSWCMC